MWTNYPNALVEYGVTVCEVWQSYGYKDTCLEKIKKHYRVDLPRSSPHWLGREDLHLSHKSKLIQKFPQFYRPKFPGVPEDLEYVWPVL